MAEVLLFPSPIATTPANQPADQHARDEALDIRRSFLVEAPAGSGKTGLLIQRFLKLLADPQVEDPRQVLAITFTRKATVEMRDRVLAQLEAAATNLPPGNDFDRLTRPFAEAALAQDRRLGWSLLEYPHRLNIRTIDSISAEIARSAPLLSGAAAALTPIEDSDPLYRAAARRTLMQLGGPDQAMHTALDLLLAHRDANLLECESLIAAMLGTRDQWGGLIPRTPEELTETFLDEEVRPRLEKALDQAICRGLTRLSQTIPEHLLSALCRLAADLGHAEGYNGNPSPIAICAGRDQPPGELAAHLEHWRALIHLLITPSKGDFRSGFNKNHVFFETKQHTEPIKQLKELIAEVRDTPGLREALCAVSCLPPARYPDEQWPVTKALFRILSHALVELQIVFAAGSECDFVEPALLARAALREHPDATMLAGGKDLQHLLVDEMQDTSSSQYELIQLLTTQWDGGSQTVFLVGDPKQSIYMFRQARVERFMHTMEHGRLGGPPNGSRDGLPLTALHLTANFRTQATLVEDFNADFARIFSPDPGAQDAIRYLPATPQRAAADEHRSWDISSLTSAAEPAEATRLRRLAHQGSAHRIREVVERWRARPLPAGRGTPWRIAILVRSRTHLLEILQALRAQPAIPFRAIEIDPLGERQEILDLLALTRALLHPADRTAWLALLRTPWVGLTLPDLHTLAAGDDETMAGATIEELLAERGELLSEDGIARIERLWQVLGAALPQRGRLPLAEWVERTWRSFRPEAFLTAEEQANIARFLDLVDELTEPGGTLNLPTLDRRLGKLYATPTSANTGAVELLTMHGAKGLEWDVVLLPALERSGQTSRSRLLSWLEMEGAPDLHDPSVARGILAPIPGRGEESKALNSWMRSVESAREAGERKRLFYVAATRAREALYLYASPKTKTDGGLSRPADSLLSAAWAAAEPHFSEAAPAAAMTRMPDAPLPALLDRMAASTGDPGSDAAAETGKPFLIGGKPPSGRAARTVLRIPLGFEPLEPAPLACEFAPAQPAAPFSRPEGSFAARAFGNTVHMLLTLTAERLNRPQASSEHVAGEVADWLPRITLFLRAAGLAPALAAREAARVQAALTTTLSDPIGRWILAPRLSARSEATLPGAEELRLRPDRTFAAGAEPLSAGDDHLWIVDYKTGTPGGLAPKAFYAAERERYGPQLEAYAAALSGELRPVRLGLYYPLAAEFLWWKHETAEGTSALIV